MNTDALPTPLQPVSHAMSALVRMKDGDLTARQLCVLLQLATNHPTPWCTGDLTKATGLPAPAATRAILRLEALGLVLNGRSTTDRRRNAVRLNKKGLWFIRKLAEGSTATTPQPTAQAN